MTDAELMAKIKKDWGPAIRAAVAGTPFPEALLAAIAANESSGDINATRFEAAELGEFALVFVGKRADYQGLGAEDLVGALSGVFSVRAAAGRLVDWCTSWGPTQIMGWQSIKAKYAIADLLDPTKHFYHTACMLAAFQKQFALRDQEFMAVPWDQYFRCWNTGNPSAPTSDPNYVTHGLARMRLYTAGPVLV